ncbi:MAG: adenylyl-sulfate kinase [Candidatus Riflebacteria bacterium]|nr:adenylyl-sulfate kinase [Candidatus Riflebacteria bacterium]
MPHREKTLLRLVTTGSVDDGKSTLIGRLLYETSSIYEDQYEAIEKTSLRKGLKQVELAYLLDGLAAEREQGITIDVAYRYFETSERKIIIADTPGHIQYTRNMITGASKSDCALILIDARNGVLTQSKRHGFLLSLLRIPHLIVAVNKMDLVDYSEEAYLRIVDEYTEYSRKLAISDVSFIPVSALKGDNVVKKSLNMPWYNGSSLLYHLENVNIASDRNLVDFRFPVQYVIRPHQNFRGFAGRIASGTIVPGEEIVVLPSRKSAVVKSITTYDGELTEAFASQSVVLTFDREIDVSRGDLIVRKNNIPQSAKSIDATICWMHDSSSKDRTFCIMKHGTRYIKTYIKRIIYKIDVNTLHRSYSDSFSLNDIGRVEIEAVSPVFFDPFVLNKATGSFILIDPVTNDTIAAGMIRGSVIDSTAISEEAHQQVVHISEASMKNVVWKSPSVSREMHERQNLHKAAVLWFTGYSGAGKSAIAENLEKRLFSNGCQTMLLDGDNLRHGLCSNLGFSREDRQENIRRAAEVAKLFFEAGNIALCTFISPFITDRQSARKLFPAGSFFEIFVKCPLETCINRDPKGLYKKAQAGEIKEFTGISSPYEPPETPEIIIESDSKSITESADYLIQILREHKILT